MFSVVFAVQLMPANRRKLCNKKNLSTILCGASGPHGHLAAGARRAFFTFFVLDPF